MKLTDRSQAGSVSLNSTIIYVVNTNDTTQNPAGSSYFATLQQVADILPSNGAIVTGGTPNNSTKQYTFTNNTGGTFTVIGLTDITITGGTYSNEILTLTNNTGGTINITGITSNAPNDLYFTSGSTGSFSIKANNNSTTDATGNYAVAEGYNTLASADAAHSQGISSTASGIGSHAEGEQTQAIGDYSHAEGSNTTAFGLNSHTEGYFTIATGFYSHAGGSYTTASGTSSFATGFGSKANGSSSHAGGSNTTANGTTSFIHSTNSVVNGDRSAIIGGQNITGNTNDTVYVPFLNIQSATTDNALTSILVKDSNGNIKLRTVTSITSGLTGTDIYVTGGTYSADTIVLTNNTGGTISITGITSSANQNQNKNKFLGGPIIGSAQTPTFRTLTDFDLENRNKYKESLTSLAYAFGDSFTVGQQSSPSTENYINKLAITNDSIITNYAVGGSGVWSACKQHFTNVKNNFYSSIWLSGFNDVRRNGGTPSTISKIKGCLRSAIVNQFLSSISPASSVSNIGTWSNITNIGDKASNAGGNARQSSTSGNTLTYTSPASSTVVIGTTNTDGATYDYGRFTVIIDGVYIDTFNPNFRTDGVSDGIYDNGRTQEVIVINGLRNTTHSVVITLIDNKTTVIDYFGVINAPMYTSPIFVGGIPKMTQTGYALTPSNGSDQAIEIANLAIQDVINEFNNLSVVYCPMDNYFNPLIHVGVDDIHPNNSGYTAIFNAFQSKIKTNIFKYLKFKGNIGEASSYTLQSNNIFRLSTNRTIEGISDVTSLAQAQMNVTVASNNSNFQFLTSNVNNTTPTVAFNITNTGNLEALKTTTTWLKLGTSSTNSAFFQVNGDVAIFSINRNGSNGVFSNTNKSSSAIYLSGVSSASTINFYTSNQNNVNPTMAMNINEKGRLFVGGSSSAHSNLQIGGSFAVPYVAKSANYTATTSDFTINCTSNSFTISLPTAVECVGRMYIIKNSGGGVISLVTENSQTIDGAAPGTLLASTLIRLQSTGSNWITI